MSNDDRLKTLAHLEVPPARHRARRRALAAGRQAFEQAGQYDDRTTTQGFRRGARLKDIASAAKGLLEMNKMIPATAVITAIIVAPAAIYVNNTTVSPAGGNGAASITPPPAAPEQTSTGKPQGDPAPQPASDAEAEAGNGTASASSASDDTPGLVRGSSDEAWSTGLNGSVSASPSESPGSSNALVVIEQDGAPTPNGASPQGMTSMMGNTAVQTGHAQLGQAHKGILPDTAPLLPGPRRTAQDSGDQFTGFDDSPVKAVATSPVSTFSVDVDTASYAYVRRMLEDGMLPQQDSVRVEELINYFDYAYPEPESADKPFRTSVEVAPSPWNAGTQIMRIGIKGYTPPAEVDSAQNLTFLIDTSGSMNDPDKLPLLKRAFRLLVDRLSANDTVSIVTYAGSAGVVLEPTPGNEKAEILGALDNLQAGGSTGGASGIAFAYEQAESALTEDSENRVILATDGDFNVGVSDPEKLEAIIANKRDTGVFLSVLGFGRGNLGDDTMQSLAQNGNGQAAYIADFREARKVLVDEMAGTLTTIAKDVKVQIEFNPAAVSEYRLIGYETRALERADFNNDKVDAGDIGAGHTVTALYEIVPAGSGAGLIDPLRYGSSDTEAAAPVDELGFLKLRYKLPNEDRSKLIEMPVTRDLAVDDLTAADTSTRFATAVAAFGQKLRGSSYVDMDWPAIRALASEARGDDDGGYRSEFVQLVDLAQSLN